MAGDVVIACREVDPVDPERISVNVDRVRVVRARVVLLARPCRRRVQDRDGRELAVVAPELEDVVGA